MVEEIMATRDSEIASECIHKNEGAIKRLVILLVSNDLEFDKRLRMVAVQRGQLVIRVESLKSALRIVHTECAGVILLDLDFAGKSCVGIGGRPSAGFEVSAGHFNDRAGGAIRFENGGFGRIRSRKICRRRFNIKYRGRHFGSAGCRTIHCATQNRRPADAAQRAGPTYSRAPVLGDQ